MTARQILVAFAIMLATGIAITYATGSDAQSGAHGDGHAETHDIYKNWSPPNNPNTSCCHGADCRPTRAYMHDDGNWRAWNGKAWLIVPWERVLPTNYAGDGRSHLCEREGMIYCFTPAEPKS